MDHRSQLSPRILRRTTDPVQGAARGQEGVALVLTLILVVLLYVIVAELATTTKLGALSADNEAMLARMNRATENALREAEQALLDDLAQQASSGAAGPAGAGASAGPGALPIPGAGGSEGAGPSDSSQDAWFEPQAYTEGDLANLTTYTWVEDENRKFNVLCLASKDEDFARDSFHRLVTLLDLFREETPQDLGRGDAEKIASAIRDLIDGKRRTEDRPRPPLKSNEEGNDVTLPLLLEEILLLPEIAEDLIGDKVVDEKLIPGLESVLTVYTGMRFDEGPPREGGAPAPAGAAGQQPAAGAGRTPTGGSPAQGGRSTATGGGSTTGGGNSVGAGSAVTNEDQAIGVGVRINVNTAPRAVLRCLMQQTDMPNEIIEALLRYRNEDVPEEESSETGAGGAPTESATTDPGTTEDKPQKKIFSTLDDLDQVPEFKNWASLEPKKKFISLLTTRSGTFTIHVAALQKIDEEKRQFVLKRARRVVMRIEDGEGALYPIIPLTDRSYLRVKPVDFPEKEKEEREKAAGTLDEYALQERDWNPFYLEFYLPKK